MTNNREIIAEALMEILERGKFSHLVMNGVLDKYSFLPKTERSYINRICEGTIEQLIFIDYTLDHFSKTKVSKMKPYIRTLLRMGTYELLFMDSIPDSAVCNETVKLAAKRGFSGLKGFVNGVLRNISRNKTMLPHPEKEKDPYNYLSIHYSMPMWLVKRWTGQFGMVRAENIMSALQEKRTITIRMDETLSETEVNEVLEQMKKTGIQISGSSELSYAYDLQKVDHIQSIPGFSQGKWMVQDLGSMMVTESADIKPGDFVLDVCGAPGGKALHAACKLKGTGKVLTRDLNEYKVNMICENIIRSGYQNISAEVFDATQRDESLIETADVVIADLPCSGLGVIGKKQDIRYRVTDEKIAEIAALQRRILSVVQEYVKPGGTLLYSTCTITREENEENTDWFLEKYPFILQKTMPMLPDEHHSDGFYIAKFVKIQEET